MSAKSASLAKSLHTVSAIVAVARVCNRPAELGLVLDPTRDALHRVQWALDVLGYAGASDPYGLAQRAVAILAKDAR